MNVLIAEDDRVSRRVLESLLVKWGYDVVSTINGEEACAALIKDDAPPLAILDWMMPGMDGVSVCKLVRSSQPRPIYIILLTAKGAKAEIVQGLQAGADDYLVKPFDGDELRARVHVGTRIITLQSNLAERVSELEQAMSEIQQLRGVLPICAYCKRIRDDENFWHQVEKYFQEHSAATFSHGVCPDCYEKLVKPELEQLRLERSLAH